MAPSYTALASSFLPLLTAVILTILLPGAGGLNETADEDSSAQQDQRTLQMTTPTFSGTQLPVDEDSDYMVKVNEVVCIKATLVASFKVKYVGRKHPKRFIVNETLLTMPKKVKVSGSCTAELSTMTLSWDGGNFSLSFDFRPDNREATPPKGRHRRDGIAKDDDVLRGWSTSEVRFSLNTEDASKFTHPLHPGRYMTRSAPSTHFFWTPRNQSFACRHEQKITLHEYDNTTRLEQNVYKVVMYMASFQMQAFDLQEDGTYGPTSACQADIFDTLPKQNIVPIVVAACLACLIIIIVIAYFISKNLGQNAYRAMD